MDDLVQWLRDRLNEDERVARRAGDSFRQIGGTGVIVATEGDRAEECASAYWTGIAEHIVRHDPAHVLAELTFKRAIVDDFVRERQVMDEAGHRTEWAEGAQSVRRLLVQTWATHYKDHPGFRAEWFA